MSLFTGCRTGIGWKTGQISPGCGMLRKELKDAVARAQSSEHVAPFLPPHFHFSPPPPSPFSFSTLLYQQPHLPYIPPPHHSPKPVISPPSPVPLGDHLVTNPPPLPPNPLLLNSHAHVHSLSPHNLFAALTTKQRQSRQMSQLQLINSWL